MTKDTSLNATPPTARSLLRKEINAVLFDAFSTTAIFALCNVVGHAVVVVALGLRPSAEHATIWVPVWVLFMLPVAYYMRYRGRIGFEARDLMWYAWLPFVMGASVDAFGTDSILVPVATFSGIVATSAARAAIPHLFPKESGTTARDQ